MNRLVIKTPYMTVVQHTTGGSATHWSNELYTWKPYFHKIADIRWYKAESFWFSDKRLAKYHNLLDRISTLEDLLEDYASYDYIWDDEIEDEVYTFCGYYIPSHSEYAIALHNDLEEYRHLLTTFQIDTSNLVSELIADNILLQDTLEWVTRN